MTEKRNRLGTVYYENDSHEVVLKFCRNCKELKALEDYPKQKNNGIGGRASACKTCKSSYYEANKVRLSSSRRKHYESNKERYADRHRKWYEGNKKHVSDIGRQYREANREQIAERCRKYQEANKERISERKRIWDENNRERIADCRRQWYERNREHACDLQRKWMRENPDKIALRNHKRRARKKFLPDDFTAEQSQLVYDHFGGCSLTGDSNEIHWDHVLPLAVGHGGTIYGNMVPLRRDLNFSKNDANIFEWFEANRQRFNLEQWRFDRLIDWLASANAMSVEEYRAYVYECHANPNVINDAKAN